MIIQRPFQSLIILEKLNPLPKHGSRTLPHLHCRVVTSTVGNRSRQPNDSESLKRDKFEIVDKTVGELDRRLSV
jgi:hypothetical protein